MPLAGPYYVASHVAGQSLVLKRNPNYAGERPQGVEEIHYEFGVPTERATEQVEAGEADYVLLDPPFDDPAPPALVAGSRPSSAHEARRQRQEASSSSPSRP